MFSCQLVGKERTSLNIPASGLDLDIYLADNALLILDSPCYECDCGMISSHCLKQVA